MLLPILLAAATGGLPPDSNLDSVIAFGNSTSYPLGVKTCKQLFPEHSDAYDAALKEWKAANADKVKAGRGIIAEEGRRTGVDTIGMIRDNQIWLDERLRAAPKEQQTNSCNQLLKEIRGDGDGDPASGSNG